MTKFVWERTFTHLEEPVLELSIQRPRFSDRSRPARRMERYYAHMTQVLQSYWTGALFAQACRALEEARAASRPFRVWRAWTIWRVTEETPEHLSVCLDIWEDRGGVRPLAARTAAVWNLRTGLPLRLSDCLSTVPHWRHAVLRELDAQIAQRLDSGTSLFFPDAARRARAGFTPERFYLEQGRVILFFPMLALGSAAEEIPVFELPEPLSQNAEE